jgi:hypothetical protein
MLRPLPFYACWAAPHHSSLKYARPAEALPATALIWASSSPRLLHVHELSRGRTRRTSIWRIPGKVALEKFETYAFGPTGMSLLNCLLLQAQCQDMEPT